MTGVAAEGMKNNEFEKDLKKMKFEQKKEMKEFSRSTALQRINCTQRPIRNGRNEFRQVK